MTVPYVRRVAYYETDKMGIVHHSNYIRWFEEARDAYVRRYGIDYTLIEARGILMPVTGVTCEYKRAAKYGDVAEIYVRPRFFNGVRLRYEYEVRAQDSGLLLVTGTSGHCFIDEVSRKPLNLKRLMPEYCEILLKLIEENGGTK